MVTLAQLTGQASSSGTAKRVRQLTASTPPSRNVVMKVMACSQCGERFAISHDAGSPDAELAERQAVWLEERFVWDHIQESKHRGSIALPAPNELDKSGQ